MVCSSLFAEEIITFNTIIEREKHNAPINVNPVGEGGGCGQGEGI